MYFISLIGVALVVQWYDYQTKKSNNQFMNTKLSNQTQKNSNKGYEFIQDHSWNLNKDSKHS